MYTVPLPPSTNQTYRVGYVKAWKRAGFFKTDKAKKWEKEVRKQIAEETNEEHPFTCSVAVNATWFVKNRKSKTRDIESGLKLFLDVWEGIIYDDDRQVHSLSLGKVLVEDKADERVEFSVIPI